jgi:ribosomal-protein-alanine N-acetyltransferase
VQFKFKPIDEEYANIVVKWKYEGAYSVYDIEHNKSDIEGIMNSVNYDCFIALDEAQNPLGFLECALDDEQILEISNFLRPDLTGRGIGSDFISSCIDFVMEYYGYDGTHIKLFVESFNKRAIKVYERVGFVVVDEVDDWIEMILEL